MLAVTENAASVIRDIAENAELPGEGGGLRFSLEATRPDEAELQVAVVREARDGDEEVESEGAHVFLDPDAAAILTDKVLDAEVLDDGQVGFSLTDRPTGD